MLNSSFLLNFLSVLSDVLEFLANLLNAPKGWYGSITSGGSESNLIGCWAARNWTYKNKQITKGKILLPKSAHVSFEKAIDLLNLKAEWISLNSDFQVEVEAVKSAIDKNTIGIIGIAGTTGTGACDNIKALSDLAEDYNLYLHIDAAFGGTIYPFLKKIGYNNVPSFDFQNKGVKSITIDTHKILAGLIPGGSIIFRSNEFSNTIIKTISYLSNPLTRQVTITGTRPGASVIASWVLLKKFGEPYILERIKKSMKITNYLIEKLKEISQIYLAFKPAINIVGFTSNLMPSKELVK